MSSQQERAAIESLMTKYAPQFQASTEAENQKGAVNKPQQSQHQQQASAPQSFSSETYLGRLLNQFEQQHTAFRTALVQQDYQEKNSFLSTTIQTMQEQVITPDASPNDLWEAMGSGVFDTTGYVGDSPIQKEAMEMQQRKRLETFTEQLAAVKDFVTADVSSRKKKSSSTVKQAINTEQGWSDLLNKNVSKKILALKRQDEKQVEELREKRIKQVLTDASGDMTPQGAHALLELAKETRDEQAMSEALKVDTLKEFLESAQETRPELLDTVEAKVEKLYADLTPEEFNKVYLETRVENAKLKASAAKFFDPENAHQLPVPDAANNIESSKILEMFNRSKPRAVRQHDILSALLGSSSVLSPTQEDIKRALKQMPQLADASLAASAEKQEVPDLTNDPLASVRDLVQNMVDMRQSVLRVYSGIKTGHRGRSPVIAFVQRDEDLVHHTMYRPAGSDIPAVMTQNAVNRIETVADHDRVDKRLVNYMHHLSYMGKERRRIRLNKRRTAFARLDNTLRAFAWLKKYNKFL